MKPCHQSTSHMLGFHAMVMQSTQPRLEQPNPALSAQSLPPEFRTYKYGPLWQNCVLQCCLILMQASSHQYFTLITFLDICTYKCIINIFLFTVYLSIQYKYDVHMSLFIQYLFMYVSCMYAPFARLPKPGSIALN